MSIQNFEAIIFDLDGTLVDSEMIWKQSELDLVNAQLHPRGEEGSMDFQMSMLGATMDSSMKLMIEHYKLEGNQADLVADLERRVVEQLPSVKAIDGSQELLEYVSQSNLKYAIASNSSREHINISVEAQTWANLIPERFSVDDVSIGKPAPDLYLFTAKALGVAPEKCIVIEDSLNGLKAAKAANMTALGKPQHDDPNKAAICDASDECFDDLHAILKYLKT